MNQIFKQSNKALLLFLLFSSISSQMQAQDSLATVYFYRVGKFAGSFIGYDLLHGDKVIGRIKSNSIIAYRSQPGYQLFKATTESESSIKIELVAGKTYFIECGIAAGVLVGRPSFRQAFSAEAKREISKIDPVIESPLRDSAANKRIYRFKG